MDFESFMRFRRNAFKHAVDASAFSFVRSRREQIFRRLCRRRAQQFPLQAHISPWSLAQNPFPQ